MVLACERRIADTRSYSRGSHRLCLGPGLGLGYGRDERYGTREALELLAVFLASPLNTRLRVPLNREGLVSSSNSARIPTPARARILAAGGASRARILAAGGASTRHPSEVALDSLESDR